MSACQFTSRGTPATNFTLRSAPSSDGSSGGVFPGQPWIPASDGGSTLTLRTAPETNFIVRAPGEGTGSVCDGLDDWILATGFWNDDGIWDDTATAANVPATTTTESIEDGEAESDVWAALNGLLDTVL